MEGMHADWGLHNVYTQETEDRDQQEWSPCLLHT